MTYREELESKLELDYDKAPKKIWNQNDVLLVWNEKQKIYTGKDDDGIIWIECLQHTKIPIFSILCTVPVRKGNIEVPCGAPNFCTILDDNKEYSCRICNGKNNIKLSPPNGSNAYLMLEKLRE